MVEKETKRLFNSQWWKKGKKDCLIPNGGKKEIKLS
jgi:hypothetical protein